MQIEIINRKVLFCVLTSPPKYYYIYFYGIKIRHLQDFFRGSCFLHSFFLKALLSSLHEFCSQFHGTLPVQPCARFKTLAAVLVTQG